MFVTAYCTSECSSTQAQHNDKAEGGAQAQDIRDEPNNRWPDKKANISAGRDRCNRRTSSLLGGVASSAQRKGEHHRKPCANQAKTQKSDRNPADNESERES